jgi:very-short-patch-repair endonuclease
MIKFNGQLKHTEEEINKMRLSKLGDKNSMFGKKHTTENIIKIKNTLQKSEVKAKMHQPRDKDFGRRIKITYTPERLKLYRERNLGNKNPKYGQKDTLETKLRKSISHKKPELIKKLRELRSKQIFPLKDTSIEIKIQNYLRELKIEFFTHTYIKDINHSYQCDILIPSINLVIECDGDYWHKYPVGNEIDHIRTSELIEKGFKVLRLWEKEINIMSMEDFKKRLEVLQ